MIKEISAENYLGIEIQEHELFDHEHLFVFEDELHFSIESIKPNFFICLY